MLLHSQIAAISEISVRWRLLETVEKLKPSSFMNHDSAPTAYLALSIKELLTQTQYFTCLSSTYLPDIETSDFSFLFSKLEREIDFSG
jgi:hypothetical protein